MLTAFLSANRFRLIVTLRLPKGLLFHIILLRLLPVNYLYHYLRNDNLIE